MIADTGGFVQENATAKLRLTAHAHELATRGRSARFLSQLRSETHSPRARAGKQEARMPAPGATCSQSSPSSTFSGVIGSVRTYVPVACATALAMAGGGVLMTTSPIDLAP